MEMYRVPIYTGLTPAALIAWVTDHSRARLGNRAVITAMCAMIPGDDASRGVIATYEEVAKHARASVGTVKRAVRWMRESDEWVVVPGTSGRAVPADQWDGLDDGRVNLYCPSIPADQLPEGVSIVGTRVIATGTPRRSTIAQHRSA